MALRFIDGFDHYSISQILRKWSFIGSGVFAIGTSGARNGSALTFPSTAAGLNVLSLGKVYENQATWIIGFAAKFPTIPVPTASAVLVCLGDSGLTQVTLCWVNGGSNHLIVRRGSGAVANTILGISSLPIPVNTWCYIEFKATIHNTTGIIQVRLNEQIVINLTGQNTRGGTANNSANTIIFNTDHTASSGSNVAWLIDDLYICDATGSVNNDFLGSINVDTLLPNAAGNYAQWTGTDYQKVDEVPPTDDTDYISSATSNQIDTYGFSNLGATVLTVKGIQTNILQRKDNSGTRTTKPLIRISSADYLLDEKTVYDNYVYDTQIKELSPATSAAWTPSEINNTEFGIKLIS